MVTLRDLNKQVGATSPRIPRSLKQMNEAAERPAQINELRREANIAKEEARKLQSFGGVAKETAKGVFGIVPSFLKNLTSVWSSTPHKFKETAKEASKDFQEGKIIKGTLKAGARTAGDATIALFAPITAAIGSVLEASGGQRLIDKTGKVVADKSGITDIEAFQRFAMTHPNAGEDFERLLMLGMAGFEKGKIKPVEMVKEARSLIRNVNDPVRTKQLRVESGAERPVAVKTPLKSYEKWLKEQGYEPIIPTAELPTIPFGKKAVSKLPTIEVGEVPSRVKFGDTVFEPIKDVQPKTISELNTAAKRIEPIDVQQVTQPVAQKVRGVDKTIQKAIDRGIKEEAFADLPRVEERAQAGFMAEQSRLAQEIVTTDYARAKRIASGQENPPGSLRAESVFKAVEKIAQMEGDVATIREIARGNIPGEAGLGLKALDSGETSVVRVINQLESIKIKTAEGRLKGKSIKKETSRLKTEMKSEMAKANTKSSFETFIKSLQC